MMTEDAAPPVIETRGLSKRYRKVTALGEATISAPPPGPGLSGWYPAAPAITGGARARACDD